MEMCIDLFRADKFVFPYVDSKPVTFWLSLRQ